MSDRAFGFTDEQVEELTRALNDRMDRKPHRPILRYPPMLKGHDVSSAQLTSMRTFEHLSQARMN